MEADYVLSSRAFSAEIQDNLPSHLTSARKLSIYCEQIAMIVRLWQHYVADFHTSSKSSRYNAEMQKLSLWRILCLEKAISASEIPIKMFLQDTMYLDEDERVPLWRFISKILELRDPLDLAEIQESTRSCLLEMQSHMKDHTLL